jgi:hypothetical protein
MFCKVMQEWPSPGLAVREKATSDSKIADAQRTYTRNITDTKPMAITAMTM